MSEEVNQKGSGPPRRDAVVSALSSARRALHLREIVARLDVAPRHEVALGRVLDDLVFDGTVSALPGHRFRLAAAQHAAEERGIVGRTIEGMLSVHPRGFGFVGTEGAGPDLFVPAEALAGGVHGDKVAAKVVAQTSRGLEGVVLEVLERRNARVPGVLRRRGRSAWVEPDDGRIRGPIVLGTQDASGQDGDAVVVRISRFPTLPEENPEGELEAVLGAPGDPEVEVQKILLAEGVEVEHDPRAVAEAEAYGGEVAPEALAGREDFTHLPLPTIDPIDARDHDDAVWAERKAEGGYRVWIAIADVSHYVRPGTALDASAVSRACSIYLPDRAIPMLPRALSSNLCSLLPDQLRLCLVAVVDLDATGAVTESRLAEGFMRSRAKLHYEGVARALGLSADAPRQEAAESYREDLQLLREISTQLRARRMRRGALDLELPEAKVVLEGKTPIDVVKRARDPGVAKAYQIVEELMLLANESVATFLLDRDVPGIFRDHDPPDPEKLARFAELATRLGVPFDAEEGSDPKKLSAFLKKTASHERKQVLHMVLMRSMKQAVYDVENRGHFGLASPGYVHFTSPIRRYPDVVVHREVKAVLRGERIDRSDRAIERMRLAATTASERERRAMTIERQVVDLHRALVMRGRLGEIFGGTVSGLSVTGAYVAIDEPFVDVTVRTESLGSSDMELDDLGLALVSRSGDRVELGDAMMVQIEDVSIPRRAVLGRRLASRVDDEDAPDRPGRRGKKSGPRGGEAPAKGAQAREGGRSRSSTGGGARAGRGAPGTRGGAPTGPSKGKAKAKASTKAKKKGR